MFAVHTQPKTLSDLTGEELLLVAIIGSNRNRRSIHRELTRRARACQFIRRAAATDSRPHLQRTRAA